jgi:hypothetical protein
VSAVALAPAPVVFIGWQDFRPYAQPYRLFTLTAPVGVHPLHSCLSEMTLLALGFTLPVTPAFQEKAAALSA